MNVDHHFSQSYAEARDKFLGAATAAGLSVDSRPHPMKGRDGEALASDIVRDGPADAKRVLLITSGCHGVEGYCGSGVQVHLLGDAAFRQAARDAGVTVLYLHALNPYGFSWWRRTTQENVDLNRNFHGFAGPMPVNAAYDEVADLLVPAEWPPTADVVAKLDDFIETRGFAALKAAVSGGQNSRADGLFYSGREPTWSHQMFRSMLRDYCRGADHLGWIDLHTGLGPSGLGERIAAVPNDAATVQRTRDWWGSVTSMYDGSSTSSVLTGVMFGAISVECPTTDYTGIALEYGTVPFEEVMDALRADQWLQNHPEADDGQRRDIKRQLRDAFYTDTPEWKQRIVEQAVEAAHQGLVGLATR
ncbi:MAG: hypothetical protein JWQ11_1725 [Rhizobacter sp.]|nr:hypothetical protein [Rhizobacter sp.]